jgi:hypothetical protein
LDVTVVPLRFTIVCQHLLLNRPGKNEAKASEVLPQQTKMLSTSQNKRVEPFRALPKPTILRPPQKLSPGSTSDFDPHLPPV